jgi:uncharacterized protein Yka (UPF0111/DUF47 family)
LLPSEASAKLRRQALNLCQELTRVSLDTVRGLHNMVIAFAEGKGAEVEFHGKKVMELKDEAANLKRSLTEELISAGAILFSREDFLRLAAPLTEISDRADGIAFRLRELFSRKQRLEKGVLGAIREHSAAVLECVLKLREVTYSLNFDIAKVESLATAVESAERTADESYRRFILKLIDSKVDIPTLVLMKDVAEMLEEIADKTEDAADASRMLALSVL